MFNYSVKVCLHPFIVSCGSFWQHSTYQKVFVMYIFLWFLLVKPQADGGVKSRYE